MTGRYDSLSREDLVRLLERRDAGQHYGLVWEREGIDPDRALNEDFVALDLDPALSTPPQDGRGWRNLVIEGDNWDALRALRLAYAGRIRCILIDPPYNTGNRDFAYNDSFVGLQDRYRHSTWLEFLYRRLLLARDLLADDGVILVCINDENRARLDLLMEQVFPGMRIGSFVWRTKDTSNNTRERAFSSVHEHILVFGNPAFRFAGERHTSDKFRLRDGDTEESRLDPITMAQDFVNRPGTYYPIQNPATGLWYPCSPLRVWSIWSRQKPTRKRNAGPPIEDYIQQGRIDFPAEVKPPLVFSTLEDLKHAIGIGQGPVDGKGRPLLRMDLPDIECWVGKPIARGRPSMKTFITGDGEVSKPASSWIASRNDSAAELDVDQLQGERQGIGTDLIMKLFGKKIFTFPKPKGLLQAVLSVAVSPQDIVLDFFAGSGTTAHAVLALNAEDDGDRRFIMVSNTEATADQPDKNLCRDVCAERIRRVIAGYADEPGLDGDFAYLRTRRVGEADTLYDFDPAAIWIFVQLRQDRPLRPFDPDAAVQWSPPAADDTPATTIAYATQASEAVIAALRAVPGALMVFTHTSGPLLEALRADVVIESLPDRLLAAFPRNVVGL